MSIRIEISFRRFSWSCSTEVGILLHFYESVVMSFLLSVYPCNVCDSKAIITNQSGPYTDDTKAVIAIGSGDLLADALEYSYESGKQGPLRFMWLCSLLLW